MACFGLSWSDKGQKVGSVLLLHFSGGPPLGDFSATSGFPVGRSRLGYVAGCLVMAWINRMESGKMAT